MYTNLSENKTCQIQESRSAGGPTGIGEGCTGAVSCDLFSVLIYFE